jgi:hypothetical protein
MRSCWSPPATTGTPSLDMLTAVPSPCPPAGTGVECRACPLRMTCLYHLVSRLTVTSSRSDLASLGGSPIRERGYDKARRQEESAAEVSKCNSGFRENPIGYDGR